MARQLGNLASAAPVPDAIKTGNVVIFAVWFDVMKSLIEQNQAPRAQTAIKRLISPVSS